MGKKSLHNRSAPKGSQKVGQDVGRFHGRLSSPNNHLARFGAVLSKQELAKGPAGLDTTEPIDVFNRKERRALQSIRGSLM